MDIMPTNVGGAADRGSAAPSTPPTLSRLLPGAFEGQAVLEKFEYGSASKPAQTLAPGPWIATDKYEEGARTLGKLQKKSAAKAE
jgi:hypothetical protein